MLSMAELLISPFQVSVSVQKGTRSGNEALFPLLTGNGCFRHGSTRLLPFVDLRTPSAFSSTHFRQLGCNTFTVPDHSQVGSFTHGISSNRLKKQIP